MKSFILAAILAVSTLSGCAGLDDHQQRVGSGALIGAGAGALIGGNATGAAIGAVGGALIGNEVDRNATRAQRDEEARRRAQDDFNRRYDQCRRYNSERYCRDTVR